MSVLTLIVYGSEIMSALSTLIVCGSEIVSGLTLIVKFDQQEGLSCTWIDLGLRDFYGVGHLLNTSLGYNVS